MNLKELLAKFNIACNSEEPINDLRINSKECKLGDVFIACKGTNHSALEFIDEALNLGAIYVLSNERTDHDKVLYLPNLEKLKYDLAYEFYGNSFENLKIIGITGTNGKTSVASLIYQSLMGLKIKTMVIGTLGVICDDYYEELDNTTPDVVILARLLALALKMGCEYVVMEVSSHSIALNRIHRIRFDWAIFTNISPEHLDYHHSFLEYLIVKGRLFSLLKPQGKAIVNIDDANSRYIVTKCPFNRVYTFGKKSRQYRLDEIVETNKGISFKINETKLDVKLLGWFSAYNLAPVYIILKSLNLDDETIISSLKNLKPINGRIERLALNDINIIVDFAHTPDAMNKVITHVKSFSKGKLFCLFGCGGNRDKIKRPQMGKIATTLCDFVIISDDNPRFENSLDIINDIVKGISKDNYQIIPDRKAAIKEAIKMLNKDDTLLILGKGHENYQIIKDKKISFSDKEEALYECSVNRIF